MIKAFLRMLADPMNTAGFSLDDLSILEPRKPKLERALMDAPTEDVVGGMGGIIARTANYRNYPNAIGYTFLYFATGMVGNGAIRLLEIDGVAPTRATLRDGIYPFTTELYAVTAGSKNPNLPIFIEWMLSQQGQRLVEKTGYTPIQAIAQSKSVSF